MRSCTAAFPAQASVIHLLLSRESILPALSLSLMLEWGVITILASFAHLTFIVAFKSLLSCFTLFTPLPCDIAEENRRSSKLPYCPD